MMGTFSTQPETPGLKGSFKYPRGSIKEQGDRYEFCNHQITE